jgi:hypothetical protein
MSVALQLGIFSAVLFALFILYFVARCQMPDFLLFGEDYKVSGVCDGVLWCVVCVWAFVCESK